MATQAAQTIPATIVIDLEAKLDQFVQNFEDKLDSIVQRLQAQQEEHRQGMREIFANFFPKTTCDEPPTMKNQEHHELHQVITTRSEATPTKTQTSLLRILSNTWWALNSQKLLLIFGS